MAQSLPVKKTGSIAEELQKMHDRVTQRAYEIFSSNGGSLRRDFEDWLQAERELVWKPAIELEEKDNQFRLEIAAPGIDPADINIEVTAEDILVSADVRHEHDETRRNVHICEFALGSLFRSIHLPKKIDPDRVKAEFKNGLVTLRAPLAEATRARKAKAGAV